MDLKLQKKLASKIFKVGIDRIKIDPTAIKEVREAMTREDIRALVEEGKIKILPKQGTSRARAREKEDKKRGPGSKKGKKTSRYPRKRKWIDKIRALRFYLMLLKKENVIENKLFRKLYNMASGGYFNSKRHLLLYLQSQQLLNEENLKKAEELLKKSKELRAQQYKR